MKIRSFFAAALVAVAAFAGCEQEEPLGLPDVTLGATDLEFTQEGGSQEMKFTATRQWKVEYDADWIAVTPEGGQGSNNEQSLTVTVTENTKANRTAKVTVTIGMVSKAFNVNQAGPGGATDGVEALTVKEFIEKADTENYYRLTGTVSGFSATYCSFDITDETGKIYVYSVTDESKSEWVDKIKNGGTVVLQGKYLFYAQKSQHEVVDAIIESFTEGGQTGGGGDTDASAVYRNNFDKAEATKTFGSGESWPYLDQFDGWMNQAGTGAAGVTYGYEGMSARANSTSDSSYSDYSGSGMNNMFFGKSAYLATYGISLGTAVNFNISFGTEKYDGNNKTAKFDPAEFHVYLSNDGVKWVELAYTFAGTEAGRWNVASADFTVPSGTSKLSVCMAADVASVYRMDDVKIVSTDKAGTAIDFSKGVEMDFAGGDDSGNNDNPGEDTDAEKPASLTKVTVAEFKTKEVNETDWYELTGKITEIQKEDWGNFVIEDETGSVLIYGMTSKWVGSNDKSFSQLDLKVGDTVTLGTLRGEYNGTPQGGGNKIPAYYISHVAGEGSSDDNNGGDNGNASVPESKGKKTVQEFIAAADNANYYELTGTVSGFNPTYCSFDLTDATGKIYVYSVLADSESQWSSKIKNGGTVTIYGKYMFYEKKSQHEVVDAYIVSYTPGEGGNEGGNDDGGDDAGSGVDPDWAYTFAKDDFGSEYSGRVTATFNGLTWNLEMDAKFFGFDSSNGRGLQMGKKTEPATLITLSTEGVTGTIKKLVVNTSGASGTNAVLTVSVGGSQFGEPAEVTKSAADYTFEGSASGKLELKWTNSAQAAVYIKSIAIELE